MTSPPAPTENYYRLRPEQTAPPGASHLPGTIQVRRFTADGLLRERALLYSDDGGHRVLKQHAYHYWMDAPANLLRDYWTVRLQGTGFTPVGQPTTRDLTLHGRLIRMERLLANDRVDIALSLELRVHRTVTGRDVLKRSYDVIQRASSDRVLDSVKAFESALQTIHVQFVADLVALPPQASRVDPQTERVSYDFRAPGSHHRPGSSSDWSRHRATTAPAVSTTNR